MIVFFFLLTACMAAVIYLDSTRFTIPNWLNGIILLLYPFALFLTDVPVNWLHALIAFGGAFVIGVLIFASRVMGGGDVKLIMALAPWVGIKAMLPFLFNMALAGGALAIFIIVGRPLVIYTYGKMNKLDKIPRLFNYNEAGHKYPMPYGVAIAASFLVLLWSGALPTLWMDEPDRSRQQQEIMVDDLPRWQYIHAPNN